MNYFKQLLFKLNGPLHEKSLQFFTVIVLSHWAEHLVQAAQIYIFNWPRDKAFGILGIWYPWVIKSEALHYFYALVMLIGLWLLKPGFTGRSYRWWQISFVLQIWHHMEHFLLQTQYILKYNLFNSPVPVSILQLYIPRVELHLFYNAVVFVPMVVAMYYHLYPNEVERKAVRCTCAWHSG
ncbi:MAG: hypothetical protein ACXVCY_00060 [Pseudobdellovibrionaceae bacterium]